MFGGSYVFLNFVTAVTIEQKSECSSSSRYIFGSNQNSSITVQSLEQKLARPLKTFCVLSLSILKFLFTTGGKIQKERCADKRVFHFDGKNTCWTKKEREREKKSCFGKHFQHPYVLYGLGKKRYFFVCLKYSLFLLKFIYSLGSANSKDFFFFFSKYIEEDL